MENVRLSRRVAAANEFAGVEVSKNGDVSVDLGPGRSFFIDGLAYDPTPIDPLDFWLIDEAYNPVFPAYFRLGSANVINVPTAQNGQQGKDTHLRFHFDGNGQYVKGESIYLETSGTPTDLYIFGHDVSVSNYNTSGVAEAYGYSASMNFEWPVDYGYAAFFSCGLGSSNANGTQFLSGVTSSVLTGHHVSVPRAVNFEAIMATAPSGSPVVASEVIGLNIWGIANDKCTTDKAYGVFLESFAKGGSGAWNHIYGIHANADTFDNTADCWFLHSLSDAPSLLSGELQFAEMTTPPANPPNGRCTIFAQDDGGGKTQLMVKFPNGAAQQIAIEV